MLYIEHVWIDTGMPLYRMGHILGKKVFQIKKLF